MRNYTWAESGCAARRDPNCGGCGTYDPHRSTGTFLAWVLLVPVRSWRPDFAHVRSRRKNSSLSFDERAIYMSVGLFW